MNRLTNLPLHPFLFALYPPLLLYTRNASSIYLTAILPAIAGLLLLVFGVGSLLRRVWTDPTRAGLTVSAILFVIFSFERNVHTWKKNGWPGSPDGREWAVLLLSLTALAGWVWFLRAWPGLAIRLQTMANGTAIALLVMLGPGLVAGLNESRTGPQTATFEPAATWTVPLARQTPTGRPDIYFIVLDAYGRSDILQSVIGYDNRAWLDRMTRKGFYLAEASTANYCQTALSVTATLNGAYHNVLAGSAGKSRLPLRAAIRDARFPRMLQAHGYRLISFATGFGLTDDFPADQRWAPLLNLPEFDSLLLDMTPIPTVLGSGAGRFAHGRHRARILYLLAHLAEVSADPAPTFTLAHIVAPHPPFVFGRAGQDISGESTSYRLADGKPWLAIEGHGDSADYAAHYRDQAAYLSARVEEVVDQILTRSPTPPIIIIQGDHGPGSHFDPDGSLPNDLNERMSILNLILLPGEAAKRLYPAITPVNTFRVVAGQLFGSKLELLPDRNYYSSYQSPYQFSDVTGQMETQPATLESSSRQDLESASQAR